MGVEIRVGVLRLAEIILGRAPKTRWLQRHPAVRAHGDAVHIEDAGAAAQSDGDVFPDADGQCGRAVDLLFAAAAAGRDGEANDAARAVAGHEEHIARRARAEVQETRPTGHGRLLHPRRDGEVVEVANDACRQCHILAGTAAQVHRVVAVTRHVGRRINQRAGPAVAGGIGGGRAAGLVEFQIRIQRR